MRNTNEEELVCIVVPSSLRYVPYLELYLDILKEKFVSYEIVYWDRFGLNEPRENCVVYRGGGLAKGIFLLPGYWGFRRFLLEYFKRRKFTKYIILSVQVAVFIYDFLRDKDYILDIRDYSHESFFPFRIISRLAISSSSLTCISSEGFLSWLPSEKQYVLSPNLRDVNFEGEVASFSRESRVISYVGAIGYFASNTKFIDGIKGLKRWSLRYIGRGTEEVNLKQYVNSHGIKNVSFLGLYAPGEKKNFYFDANFILCCYGNNSIVVKTALPNRLYEACAYRRPIIVNTGTYLAQVVKSNGLGIVCDLDNLDTLESELDKYYDDVFYRNYVHSCEKFLHMVSNDLLYFKAAVTEFLESS